MVSRPSLRTMLVGGVFIAAYGLCSIDGTRVWGAEASDTDPLFGKRLNEMERKLVVLIDLMSKQEQQLTKVDSILHAALDTPVGTIVSSFLSVDQFYEATKSNERSPGNKWTSAKSKWCPADGRPVPDSLFQKITSVRKVPDLRGMFLRGLNVMDSVPQVPLDPDDSDPEDRKVGSYQSDEIKMHTHELQNAKFKYLEPHISDQVQGGNYAHRPFPAEANIKTKEYGENLSGKETRPKNIAVYYYIRIN